jgi:hypothetical protein
MNKNEVCRDILNMQEVLGTKLAEHVAQNEILAGLNVAQKRELTLLFQNSVSEVFNSVVDRVLKA